MYKIQFIFLIISMKKILFNFQKLNFLRLLDDYVIIQLRSHFGGGIWKLK